MPTVAASRFPIVETRFLAPDVKLFRIRAPRIAVRQKPGQFLILRTHAQGERIPLTIADSSPKDGTVTVIVQGIGKTTRLLNTFDTGDAVADVVGPLGKPSEIARFGTAVVISGGVGTAIAYPTARALKAAGNDVVSIVGARTMALVILEAEMRATSDETFVTTDDGSYGRKGVGTDVLDAVIASGRRVDYVLAIGPVPMMRAVADLTRSLGIRTVVSLNPIMVDGTGMCGGCRVLVGGRTRFACVDGPEFDAHGVDFDVLARRNAMYHVQERQALAEFSRAPTANVSPACRLDEQHATAVPTD
jgi:ferredoxin--NADP+ reductase